MTKKVPFGRLSVAEYLEWAIYESGKTQREIAEEVGYDKPNIITMFKQGLTKLPLEKVPVMAKALGVSRRYLMILALREYSPRLLGVIEETFGLQVTDNEEAIIKLIRTLTDGGDPGIGGPVRGGLEKTFGWIGSGGKP